MKHSVKVTNPKTSEVRTILVDAGAAIANASPCLQTYVQTLAKKSISDGFMACGNGVRALLQ